MKKEKIIKIKHRGYTIKICHDYDVRRANGDYLYSVYRVVERPINFVLANCGAKTLVTVKACIRREIDLTYFNARGKK